VVNVSGSLGSRLLLASLTIAGNNTDLKTKIEENNDQLRDLASSVLSTKTITDLEKPEARNLIRAELISQFNTILGGTVQDIYITEFAIQ
jgi:flagellar basal body-associated protein FliL